jgi:hypothetical protein
MSEIGSLCLLVPPKGVPGGDGVVTYGLWCDDNSNSMTLCGARDILVATVGYVGVRLVHSCWTPIAPS